jgi:hypothetical protein
MIFEALRAGGRVMRLETVLPEVAAPDQQLG